MTAKFKSTGQDTFAVASASKNIGFHCAIDLLDASAIQQSRKDAMMCKEVV
jgi:hypothetical protein